MYEAALARFLSQDPAESDPNLYLYVNNDPVNTIDPSGLGPQWHHLLPKVEELQKFFTSLGFNVHSDEFGWELDSADHAKLHGKWNAEWKSWIDKRKELGLPTTKQDVLDKLYGVPDPKNPGKRINGMFQDLRFAPYLNKGHKSNLNYLDWSKLTPDAKVKHFNRLKKLFAIFAALTAVLGAATDACAYLAPVTDLAKQEQQEIYLHIVDALETSDFAEATALLFGRNERCAIEQENPDGLVCKMLSKLFDANRLTLGALLLLEDEAREKWNQWVMEAQKDADYPR